jgi:hypothetical protein
MQARYMVSVMPRIKRSQTAHEAAFCRAETAIMHQRTCHEEVTCYGQYIGLHTLALNYKGVLEDWIMDYVRFPTLQPMANIKV